MTTQDREVQEDSAQKPLSMIKRQMRRNPDAVAIETAEGCVSYGDLDARSSALASALIENGVSPGDRIALYMPRSVDFVVSALGALRARAAYVPVDPDAPQRRLSRILASCKPALVISSGSVALPVIDWPSIHIDALTDGASSVAASETDALDNAAALDDLAYVLYTSGTSGEPRGVQIGSKGLANYLNWATNTYAVSDTYDALWHSATTFDLSITSYLAPLAAGGRIEIIPTSGELDALVRRLETIEQPRVVKITPSHATAIISWFTGRKKSNNTSLVFVVGGETLFSGTADALMQAFPNSRVYNEYGPTETTVGCCVEQWSEGGEAHSRAVPIGTPISGMDLHILDDKNKPVADGTTGQIAIAGVGVMLGYLGDTELTAEKLVNAPVSDQRCYLTGDIGTKLEDGRFLFSGRLDAQMKVRGFRVEPGEIEATACSVDQVRTAAAILRPLHSGDTTEALVLFVEADGDKATIERELAAALSLELPAYLHPAQIVAMAALPLTEHGKINRKSLRESALVTAASEMVPPSDSIEDTLAAVWCHVLNYEEVLPEDNYYVLGGDSLRSIEITALAAERGVKFSIAQLHSNPTVRQLALAIRSGASLTTPAVSEPFPFVSREDRLKFPDDIEDAYPLNLLQQGMIYHREFAEKSAVYHAICSYHVEMPVNVDAMRESAKELVARHPLLRTSFDLTRYSQPLQIVHRESVPSFGYLDLREVDENTHQDYVDEWLEAEKRRGFEIEEYPLIRFHLHHFSENSCQLAYSFHHEIIDGWSDALMVTELMNRYMSKIRGVAFEPPTIRSMFRDSILLEREAVSNAEYRDFWNSKMQEVSVMKLPSFVPTRADKGQREIIKFEVPISVELSDDIKRLATELAVPLKTVLLAAHMKAMSLLGGVEDVISYTVSNGRPDNHDSHAVIGLFVNSLAFRMKLSGGSWADLIMQTLLTENELLERRRYPMAELKRQHGSEPLSETLFFFNHYHVTDALTRWDEVSLLELKVYAESTFPYCVNAFLTPFDKDLRVRIEYDELRYDRQTMDIAEHFYLSILQAMVADRHALYQDYSLLPPAELDRFETFAQTGTQALANSTGSDFEPVIASIARMAIDNPTGLAIVSPEEQLTYEELNQRIKRVAAYLHANELTSPGSHVAIHMNRGAASVIATLAVLHSGSAYVPLNPDQPEARTLEVLERIDGPVICDEEQAKRLLKGGLSASTLVRYSDAIAYDSSTDGVEITLVPSAPAYVIFTSGSTGVPKATMVSHANLAAATQARIDYYSLSANDRCALLPSPAFDSAVAVLFGALASGATLVVPDVDVMVDLDALVSFLGDAQTTMTLCTPSLLDTLLQTHGFDKLALRQIISAGEPMLADTAERANAIDGATVFNEYGPTETTVWASVWQWRLGSQAASMPIGGPISTASLYVLDRQLHPVPTGVLGELYVGGVGVTHGYLGESAQTASGYLPDPFSSKPGARMYRTGDLVRSNLEGELEFIARRDRLVKLQGFRVEPGEVEHTLTLHPAVRRAIALVKDINGSRQLVAYIVRDVVDDSITGATLKAFCQQTLPKYMVPSHIVFVDAVPLSRTGKVDFDSLEKVSPQITRRDGEPQTPLQALLVDIWRANLHVDEVGIYDDFTELGGESLAALRIAAKVRSALSEEVPVRTLLASMSTVADLADTLAKRVKVDTTEESVPELEEVGEI